MPEGFPEDPIAALEVRAEKDPSAAVALAELHRRAGDAVLAEALARRGLADPTASDAARAVLGLVLLDRGRIEEARRELAQLAAGWLGAQGIDTAGGEFRGELTDQELEIAFARAETEQDEVIDADRVAHDAIRETDGGAGEELAELASDTFTTQTMANLLERQGDAAGASRIRAALDVGEGVSEAGLDRREKVIVVLENWLANLRREARA